MNPGAEVQGQYSGGAAVELFTIGELDSVWALADVFEMDLGRVRKGAPVTLKVVAYPDRVFSGQGRLHLRLARPDRAHRARALLGRQPDPRAQARDVRDGEHRRRRQPGARAARAPRCCTSPTRR